MKQHSSILFQTKGVFILGQLSKCKLVDLLEINDTFSSKLNVSSCMTLQILLNILKIFITTLYKKHSGKVVLLDTTKLFEIRKILKIKVLIWHMLGIMVKKLEQWKVLPFMQVFLHTMIWSETFIT